MSAKVTRLAPGIYDVRVGEVTYELERYPDGSWLTFKPSPRPDGNREYMQDYTTKRAAVEALVEFG